MFTWLSSLFGSAVQSSATSWTVVATGALNLVNQLVSALWGVALPTDLLGELNTALLTLIGLFHVSTTQATHAAAVVASQTPQTIVVQAVPVPPAQIPVTGTPVKTIDDFPQGG